MTLNKRRRRRLQQRQTEAIVGMLQIALNPPSQMLHCAQADDFPDR